MNTTRTAGATAPAPALVPAPAPAPAPDTTAGSRVVFVTGAGTGIGRATALAFATEGARVIAVGRRPGPLAETAAAAEHPSRIAPFVADLTREGAAGELVREALGTYGRLDVLVNNAGIVGDGALGTYTRGGIEAQLATNLVAPVLLTQSALPALAERGGVVVNVSTSVGLRAWPGNAVYASAKAALELLTRSWAVELAPRGIRVVAVAPGAIDTPIGAHRGLSPQEQAAVRDWQVAHTPLGRVGRPEEVTWAITRLASPAGSLRIPALRRGPLDRPRTQHPPAPGCRADLGRRPGIRPLPGRRGARGRAVRRQAADRAGPARRTGRTDRGAVRGAGQTGRGTGRATGAAP